MSELSKKQAAAKAALAFVPADTVIGIGTGSTVDCFIEVLAASGISIEGAIASSLHTEQRLRAYGIPIVELNHVANLDLYIDGADEVDEHKRMIKGAGGALTREKIIASLAKQFLCIIDDSKQVEILGRQCPVPIEVIPMARSSVARQIVALGGDPEYREHVITDNGHVLLDVYHLDLSDPLRMEQGLAHLAGVVESGIFAARRADKVLVGTQTGVMTK